MFTRERLPKRSRFRAYVYPYVLLIACLCLLLIIHSARQTQIIKHHSEKVISFQLNKDIQQNFKTLLEAKLEEHSWQACLNWINNHPALYFDLNGDNVSDSVCLLTYLGFTGQITEIGACHYLLKSTYWGSADLPSVSIPLETNINKRIRTLPNRYSISPGIGLMYRLDMTLFSILYAKKITILHNIE